MTSTPHYISQRQFVVTVSSNVASAPITGVFMTKTGGNSAADSTKVYGGGTKTPAIVTGITETENVTIGRAYDQVRDSAEIKTLRQWVGSLTATITVQETDADYVQTGKPKTTYTDAVLVGINEPEYESSSGDPAMMELEFAVVSAT